MSSLIKDFDAAAICVGTRSDGKSVKVLDLVLKTDFWRVQSMVNHKRVECEEGRLIEIPKSVKVRVPSEAELKFILKSFAAPDVHSKFEKFQIGDFYGTSDFYETDILAIKQELNRSNPVGHQKWTPVGEITNFCLVIE